MEVDEVDAVEQVLPEGTRGHHALQVAAGGADDPYVRRARGTLAQPLVLPLLEDAQQFDLGGGGQVADLVEEQRAPLRQLEAALAVGTGVGKSPGFVAEELRFEEAFRHPAEVDGHERSVRAVAGAVDGLGDQFLARAALAGDEHRGLGTGYAAGLFDDGLQGRRLPDDGREGVGRSATGGLFFGKASGISPLAIGASPAV